MHLPRAMLQAAMDLWMRQRDPHEGLGCVANFRLRSSQKTLSNRGIKEQIADFNGGTHRAAGWLNRLCLATVNTEFGAAFGRRGSRPEERTAHLGDRCQRLASEAHGGHFEQVVRRGDLACGVVRYGQHQLVGCDATAVVRHADQFPATLLQPHVDPIRAGVDGVFEQFFHHAGWTLNDFPGRNLIYHRGSELLNTWHGVFARGPSSVPVYASNQRRKRRSTGRARVRGPSTGLLAIRLPAYRK